MLPIVALPEAESVAAPSPKNSTTQFVAPLVLSMPVSLRITSLAEAQP